MKIEELKHIQKELYNTSFNDRSVFAAFAILAYEFFEPLLSHQILKEEVANQLEHFFGQKERIYSDIYVSRLLTKICNDMRSKSNGSISLDKIFCPQRLINKLKQEHNIQDANKMKFLGREIRPIEGNYNYIICFGKRKFDNIGLESCIYFGEVKNG